MGIIIKSDREIAIMRRAGRIIGTTLEELRNRLKPGMKTAELDKIAEEMLRKMGAAPSFKGYHGFPASLCVSVNEEIVHGIPGDRILKEGDLVSLDLGAVVEGFQADAAISAGVGQVSADVEDLIKATADSLAEGLAAARDGNHLGDIGEAVEDCAKRHGFNVVKNYGGHGIGRSMHEDPHIPNFGRSGSGPKLRKGMTLAVEPMLSAGSCENKVGADAWTVVTADGKLAAHAEHTIAITEGEAEVLTLAR
ncbi:type I methionyl aminopeptidase [Dehalogenimonas alkenigignens]|uniref:Methionine aminopeptidase n=1 Tax=Dehalogenimonas alkenigignens TaxID=1217799 RepID=A0A0W0GFX7_9CHLR|nr:type I methionyl aminopeptidase [Dehalogenimonas alkenigignens]KTB47463.1 methionine aminopeptidase, type I [Dehalogenimonas alkenigignens]PVV83477.1 type I methionyl aminopeptidase [Dehalogenimonas alkenigignens]